MGIDSNRLLTYNVGLILDRIATERVARYFHGRANNNDGKVPRAVAHEGLVGNGDEDESVDNRGDRSKGERGIVGPDGYGRGFGYVVHVGEDSGSDKVRSLLWRWCRVNRRRRMHGR